MLHKHLSRALKQGILAQKYVQLPLEIQVVLQGCYTVPEDKLFSCPVKNLRCTGFLLLHQGKRTETYRVIGKEKEWNLEKVLLLKPENSLV